MMKKISILIPVYNEGENIQLFMDSLTKTIDTMPSYAFSTVFIDDGSKDDTLHYIKKIKQNNPTTVHFVSFSRNFGHQNALKAGLDLIDADAIISMDGDLQHPPSLIPQMIKEWEAGKEIVYTIRKENKETSFLKRNSSKLFYTLLNKLSNIELEKGTADFRLLDRKVVNAIKAIHEYDLFWRGLIKWIGFEQIGIEYTAAERVGGTSKYTFRKMTELALKGITSFSTKPLSIAIYIGLVSSLISILYIPYALISYYLGYAISGWASIIVTIAFFGGIQLMILGIIGIYLGKLFMQNKNRPHYIIKESTLS